MIPVVLETEKPDLSEKYKLAVEPGKNWRIPFLETL
jgi:hypothetical protein